MQRRRSIVYLDILVFLLKRASPANGSSHGADDEQHQEYEEQDLCDFRSGSGNTREAENTGNDRDDQKGKRPTEHGKNLQG